MTQPEAPETEVTSALTEGSDLHWLLKRNDDGEIVIRWGIALVRLIVMIATFAIFGWITNLILGKPFRPTSNVVLYGLMVACLIWYLGSIQRRAQGRPKWQFHLRDVLVLITAIALMLGVNRWELESTSKRNAARREILTQLQQIVRLGSVHISGDPATITIVTKHKSFNNFDLLELLTQYDRLKAAEAPITFLDLSGTQVTNRGAASLASLHSLEHCFLDGTQITDSAVDALQQLPQLKVLSVRNTGVSTERLKQLSIDRPDLDIEPKTYQKVQP